MELITSGVFTELRCRYINFLETTDEILPSSFLPTSSFSFFQQILECFLVSGAQDLTQSSSQPGASERKGSATRDPDINQRTKYAIE